MSNKVLSPDYDINTPYIEQLPDRSDLSSLYFKPTNNYYAGKVSVKKKVTTKDRKKLINRSCYEIGFLLALPFVAAEIILSFILSLAAGQLNLYVLFPASLSVVFFIWLISHTFMATHQRLVEMEISTSFVLTYVNICLLFTGWSIYLFSISFGDIVISNLIFAGIITILTTAICKLLVLLASDINIAYSLKISMLFLPIVMSIIISLISILLPIML